MAKYVDDYLTIALPKGKLFSLSANLFEKVGVTAEHLSEKSRKLIISNDECKVRFIITKTSDVPTYVEYGAADIGVIGKDVLVESGQDVYELLDLGFGKCRLMMAVPREAACWTMHIHGWRPSIRILQSNSLHSRECRWSI